MRPLVRRTLSAGAVVATSALLGVLAPAVASAADGTAGAPATSTGQADVEEVTSVSAITAMWLWDNSVDPSVDGRGTGYAFATPAQVVAFAQEHGLETIHVSAPWASDEGPVATWMTDTLVALDAAGIDAGVLGGDPPWLDNPALAVQHYEAWRDLIDRG